MSVLSLPRIHFKGLTFWSPSTANNHSEVYNEPSVTPHLQPTWTYEDFAQKLKTENKAWCEPWGSWNLYGDHAVRFNSASVTGVQLDGPLTTSDPLCGADVNLYGKDWYQDTPPGRLVMTDPFSWGSETSQIFFDKIVVGNQQIGFTATGRTPFYSKWGFRPSSLTAVKTTGCPSPAGPARNLNLDPEKPLIFEGTESCCWWAGLAYADIQWFGVEQSLALKKLQNAAKSAQGIVFRFVSYCTQYYVSNPKIQNGIELVEAYQQGFEGDNPARSSMLGTIGVWEAGELSSAPTDLPLSPTGQKALPTFSASLGPAMAKIDTTRNVVVLDLVNAIPENDPSLVKADFGALDLYAGSSLVGSLQYADYQRSAYEATGGICEISIPKGMDPGAAPFTLQSGGAALLAQDEFLAETDQWAVYVDEDQTSTITVTVTQDGAPASEGTMLMLVQYNSQSGNPLSGPYASSPDPLVVIIDQQQNVLHDPAIVSVIQGRATFGVRPVRPGACVIGFLPFKGVQPEWCPCPPASITAKVSSGVPCIPSQNFPVPDYRYTCIRALPFDNALEANTPDSSLNWPFMYTNVLRVFDLMYPAMSKVVNLANLPAVEGMQMALKAAIDPSQFLSALYMPITRDLSAGKRKLLQRFVNLMPNIPAPPPVS
jgi:hypothetical protein